MNIVGVIISAMVWLFVLAFIGAIIAIPLWIVGAILTSL